MSAWLKPAAGIIAFFLALQAVWTAYYGTFNPAYHRTIVFGLCALCVVLHRPLATQIRSDRTIWKAAAWLVDAVAVAAIGLAIQRFIAGQASFASMLVDTPPLDQWLALAALAATLELTRREFGLGLSLVAGGVLVYCFVGQNLPGILQHAGFSLAQIVEGMWYGFQGVFGMPVAVVIDLLFIYIVFGMVLEATGAGAALIRIAARLTGRVAGGSAHAAIVASALFGSISGSVTANVAGTGTFTIPMMRQKGFRPEFAGAVEAAASTAGQFIPPVMGAAAFMLAQMTGTNYLLVCAAALVPALFYIVALFLAVYLEARRSGITGEDPADLPPLTRADLRASVMFLVPVVIVVAVMLTGRSPAIAGFWASTTGLALGFLLNPELRANPMRLVNALVQGGLSGAKIMMAVGAIGIVVSGFNLTGLGLSFSQSIGALGSDNLTASLLLTAFACLVLGMGMPTLPAYLIIVLVMGQALTSMGIPRLAVHMFVFYFAALSAITPPVALAAFAAAPIARARPMRIAMVSMRLTLIGFIVPFVFVENPSLLLVIGFDPAEFGLGLAQLAGLVWTLAVGFAGFGFGTAVPPVERVLHFAVAGVFLIPSLGAVVVGSAFVLGLLLLQVRRRNDLASIRT